MLARSHPFARFLPALLALVLVACGGSTAMPSAAPTGATPAGRDAVRQPVQPAGHPTPAAPVGGHARRHICARRRRADCGAGC